MSRTWLKELRLQQQLTQKDMAEQAGISRAYYSQIESQNRRPSPEVAQRIAHILDFSWTSFYEED